jgi:DNA-binding NarL/FixJ family response regulator
LDAVSTAASICVAWIDAFSLTRDSLTRALASTPQLFTIVPFASVDDCIKAPEQRTDLIVYHDHETRSVNVADVAALRGAFTSTQLVILSDMSTVGPALVEEVLAQGASAFMKSSETNYPMLLSSLTLVASGGTIVPRELLISGGKVEEPKTRGPLRDAAQLTTRELEILQLLKQGKTNRFIAHELKLSVATVKIYVRDSMRKIGSPNRTHLAMVADSYIAAQAA